MMNTMKTRTGANVKPSCKQSTKVYTAPAYLSFWSRMIVIANSPKRDASISQGCPQKYIASTHLYLIQKKAVGKFKNLSRAGRNSLNCRYSLESLTQTACSHECLR